MRIYGREVRLGVEVDEQANAGTILFGNIDSERGFTDLAVTDADGSIAAVLTLDEAGRLAQIELLDVARQLPDQLR